MNEEKKDIRNSNIELLRIVAALGVIVLHYNNAQMGGGFAYVEMFSINSYIMYFLENVFICAVDLFVLITGFFMSEKKQVSVIKPIELLCQVVMFNIGALLLRTILFGDFLTWKEYLVGVLPLNYYVTLYIVVYVLSPYINMLLSGLRDESFKMLVIILMILFSVWPTILEALTMFVGGDFGGMNTVGIGGSQRGYTSLNFIMMYIIGAYVKRVALHKKPMQYVWKLILCWSIQFVLSYGLQVLGKDTGTIWAYCNPVVILTAVYSFLLFYNLKGIKSRVVNALAKASFSVYLLHTLFLSKIKIEYFVAQNPVIYIMHVILASVLIYLVCYIVFWVYDMIAKKIFGWICKKVQMPVIRCEYVDRRSY